MKKLALILLALLVGCAAMKQGRMSEPQKTVKTLKNYELNQPITASIGNPIIRVQSINGLNIYYPADNYVLSEPYLMGRKIEVPKTDKFSVYHSFNFDGVYSILISNEKLLLDSSRFFISINADGTIAKGWINRFRQLSNPHADFSNIKFQKSNDVDGDNFTWELVYQGKSGATVKMLYREYNNDYIRDKFSQELEYNLLEDSTFAYKNLVGRINSATNTTLNITITNE